MRLKLTPHMRNILQENGCDLLLAEYKNRDFSDNFDKMEKEVKNMFKQYSVSKNYCVSIRDNPRNEEERYLIIKKQLERKSRLSFWQ